MKIKPKQQFATNFTQFKKKSIKFIPFLASIISTIKPKPKLLKNKNHCSLSMSN